MLRRRPRELDLYEHYVNEFTRKTNLSSVGSHHSLGGDQRIHKIGSKLAQRDVRLIESLRQRKGEDEGLDTFLPNLERPLPQEVLRWRVEGGAHRFVWFERWVIGRNLSYGSTKDLPAGAVFLCMDVTTARDVLDLWKVRVTVVDLWRNAKPAVHEERPWYRREEESPQALFERVLRRLLLGALDPALVAIRRSESEFNSYSERMTFSVVAPTAAADPDGSRFKIIEAAVTSINASNLAYDGEEIFEHFSIHDAKKPTTEFARGQITVARASDAEMREVLTLSDDKRGHKKAPLERPPVNHRHAVVVIRDRAMQVDAKGHVVETETPPKLESMWIHWVFCIDMATTTFYVEPFVPAQGPVDFTAFLNRAWSADGTSVLRAAPRELELPMTILKGKSRKAFETALSEKGVILDAPKHGGGHCLSLARNWISDSITNYDRPPLKTMDQVRQWGRAHMAGILQCNLGHRRDSHEGLSRALTAMHYGHYLCATSVRFNEFCAAMKIDQDAEYNRLLKILSDNAIGSRDRDQVNSKFIQVKATVSGSKPVVWRRLQLPYHSTLFGLHCALADVFECDPAEQHYFEIQRTDREGAILRTALTGSRDELSVNHGMRETFSQPGQEATYTTFPGNRSLEVTLKVEDLVLIKTEMASTPPRCVAGAGWIDGASDLRDFDPASVEWTDDRELMQELYEW